MFKEIERSGNNYRLRRTSNPFDISCSGFPGREIIDVHDRCELFISNEICSLVFADYLARDICQKQARD